MGATRSRHGEYKKQREVGKMGRGGGKELGAAVKIPFAAAAVVTGPLPSCSLTSPLGALRVIGLLPCLITLPVLCNEFLWRRQGTCPTTGCQKPPERDTDLLALSLMPLLTHPQPSCWCCPSALLQANGACPGPRTVGFLRGNFI